MLVDRLIQYLYIGTYQLYQNATASRLHWVNRVPESHKPDDAAMNNVTSIKLHMMMYRMPVRLQIAGLVTWIISKLTERLTLKRHDDLNDMVELGNMLWVKKEFPDKDLKLKSLVVTSPTMLEETHWAPSKVDAFKGRIKKWQCEEFLGTGSMRRQSVPNVWRRQGWWLWDPQRRGSIRPRGAPSELHQVSTACW